MAEFKITKGYDVPIAGQAKEELTDATPAPFLGVCPSEFPGLKPKLSVALNDAVKVGSPLFYDKRDPELQFLSPAGGRVTAINYGPRRVIEEIVISRDATEQYESFPAFTSAQIAALDRGSLISHLRKGGVWPYLRSRPFDRLADATQTPKAIFVNCMETAPLGNNPSFSLRDKGEAFAAGLAAMKVLCPQVHVCTAPGASNVFAATGAQAHTFSGPHPAGLVSTHISRVAPLNKGEQVWYIHARDLVMVGTLLLSGRYPTERVVAIAGPGAAKSGYVRGRIGTKLNHWVQGRTANGEQRLITGNVLHGRACSEGSYLGFYDDLITILPEGREQHFLGWLSPGFDVPSFTRNFVSGFLGGKQYAMNTNRNGGHRAIIQSGMWEEVVALDIYPEYLVKAALAEDIDAMERLGIYECAPEDFALCTYVCPSKTEVCEIIAKGLELVEKEG